MSPPGGVFLSPHCGLEMFSPPAVTATRRWKIKPGSFHQHKQFQLWFIVAATSAIKTAIFDKSDSMRRPYFQIYSTSILHTYKISRKLQNIYYYQEGIIMLRSRQDHNMQNTGTLQSLVFFLCTNIIYCHEHIKISHICTKKAKI